MVSVAVVTGGTRGIGRAILIELAKSGYDLAFCYLNSVEAAKELASQIRREYAVRCLPLQADVADHQSVAGLAQAVSAEFSQVSALVNNAGIVRDRTVRKMTQDEWHQVVQTNLNSVFYCCQAFLPLLAEGASVVNISSIIGEIGAFGQANYAAAKSGIIGFSLSLAREVARSQVRVNVVTPGFIATEMAAAIPAEQQAKITGAIPLGRMGQPAEVAGLVRYLCSPEAAYITGSVLRIDGGYGLK